MTLTGSSHKGDGFAQFRQMYVWELKRSRVLAAVYAALTLLCFTVIFICQTVGIRSDYYGPNAAENLAADLSGEQIAESFSDAVRTAFNIDASLTLVPLSMLFVAVFCVITFGYMHNRRSVVLFHALPIRRTPLLLAGMAAGGTILLIVPSVSMLLACAVAAGMGVTAPLALPLVLAKLGFLLLILAAALALTTTLLVCSGTVLNAIISGLLLLGGWPMLCLCATAIIRTTLPGCTLEVSLKGVTWFVPWLAGLIPFAGSFLSVAVSGTDGGWVPESTQWPETTIDVPVGAIRAFDVLADNPGDWAFHCHKSHHTMNAMGHDLRTLIGVSKKDIAKAVKRLAPDSMAMGSTGMAMGEMEMPLPDNTLPMMTGSGQFGPIEMGGMFTVMKIREGMGRDDYSDPGPYKFPKGTVAYEIETPAAEPPRRDSQPIGPTNKDTKAMKGVKSTKSTKNKGA